ncbi:MAG: PilW family protein [Litorivicinus sp.]
MKRGFSLIELMISLLIGSLLMLGVFNVLVGAKQAYQVQDELNRTQESARFAAEFIARDMRMAGFRGCRASLPLSLMVNNAGADWRYNLTRPLNGFQGVAQFPSQLASPFSSALHDPDAIAVLGVDDQRVVAIASEGAGQLTLADAHDYAVGEALLAANCERAALFQVSANTAGTVALKHEVQAGLTPGNCANLLGGTCASPTSSGIDLGGSVMPLRARAYYLSTDINGIPGLYRAEVRAQGVVDRDELVPGIEDMRVWFGQDSDGDGVPNRYVRASDAAFDPDLAISVQIVFLVRTLMPPDASIKPYVFDGTTFTPTDGHVRRQVSMTINLRNRLL